MDLHTTSKSKRIQFYYRLSRTSTQKNYISIFQKTFPVLHDANISESHTTPAVPVFVRVFRIDFFTGYGYAFPLDLPVSARITAEQVHRKCNPPVPTPCLSRLIPRTTTAIHRRVHKCIYSSCHKLPLITRALIQPPACNLP